MAISKATREQAQRLVLSQLNYALEHYFILRHDLNEIVRDGDKDDPLIGYALEGVKVKQDELNNKIGTMFIDVVRHNVRQIPVDPRSSWLYEEYKEDAATSWVDLVKSLRNENQDKPDAVAVLDEILFMMGVR